MSKLEKFIEKAHLKFGNKFDYSETVFVNVDAKTIIACPTHGKFQQTPYHHLKSKYGCKKCGEQASAEAKEKDLESFIIKANKIHKDKYTYENSIYTGAKNKITITCPDHGDFEQLVSGHLSGYGCKHCASHGKGRVNMDNQCTLYYLKLVDLDFYKIGITSTSITNRYRTAFDQEQFEIVFTKTYQTGREAYTIEQKLLKYFASVGYVGDKILKTGNTEIFTEDIFKGDYSYFTH